LHSPDVDPLSAFVPEDPESFGVLVQAMIGPAGAHLFVDRWDYAVVERAIGDLCAHSEGSDWNEVAARLACYGHWEFGR